MAATISADLQQLLAFHWTGEKPSDASSDAGESGLCPALLIKYRDLSRLRYDYPLVLVDGGADHFVTSLSAACNAALQEVAPPGIEGERLRKSVLRLESEIRALVSSGQRGSLMELWDLAGENLLARSRDGKEGNEILRSGLRRARAAARCDGELVDCNPEAPSKLLIHAWNVIQKRRGQRVSAAINELIIKLSDVLTADFMKSDEARKPEALKPTIGKGYQDELDFEVLSNVLTETFPKDSLPEKRRERVRFALATLESQRFFPPAAAARQQDSPRQQHSFLFDDCTKALETFHDRLPEMVAFVKAVRIAELEIENQYKEAKHDQFFDQFSQSSLTTEDIALFPSYLVCLTAKQQGDAGKVKLMEILSSDLPIKVLLETDEALETSSVVADGGSPLASWNLRLASMAVNLQSAYVLQSTSSNLYQMTAGVSAGLEFVGPALFSVFSPSDENFWNLRPYLVSASAMQSRAFPAFTYDPSAGQDWASRFSIASNPQPEVIWPTYELTYEDKDLQRMSRAIAFTYVDFAACDKRLAAHFMTVAEGKGLEAMVPVQEYLGLGKQQALDKIPYILMVDEKGVLHKTIVSDRLMRAARHCAEMWRNLQELGGVNNSHSLRLLAKEKQAWDEQKQKEIEELKGKLQEQAGRVAVAAAQEPTAAELPKAAEPAPEEQVSFDEPSIETPRCTTCNECTTKNSRMFAYNENKQAYIKDISAGTYKDLVEAAEKCQVCIIHPGKPKNPDEPNLEELIKRAEPFNQPRARRAA